MVKSDYDFNQLRRQPARPDRASVRQRDHALSGDVIKATLKGRCPPVPDACAIRAAVFRLGGVRTPIIGRPRHLPGQRRAADRYTLNCEEPYLSSTRISGQGFGAGVLTLCKLPPAH